MTTRTEAPAPVSFGLITDPTRQHAFFCAVVASEWERFSAAYDRDDELNIEPFEFTDPLIVAQTQDWVAHASKEHGRPPMVMVGSIENGRWVNWNLPELPLPPVPTY
ncbi:hypothetical protein [Streptomyces sp. NPDC001978]|uniref:hypothetical protein n=1 Tax=Streptomyces sp. NPDC001978 TaxID=3364627 RepID=UPI003679AE72